MCEANAVIDPLIENGNIFSAIGHQVARLISRWTHQNSSSSLPSPDTVDDYTMSGPRHQRVLQWLTDESPVTEAPTPPHHKVRHSKSRRKPVAVPTTPPTTAVPTSSSTTPAPTAPARRLERHDTCYNTNEVLLIIAITCAVNFAFIFVIMALVHVCNRNNKVAGISGLESLIIDNGDCVSQERGSQKLTLVLTPDQSMTKLCESNSYNSVQDYVNSLPSVMNDRDFVCDRTPSMLSLHSLDPLRNKFQESMDLKRQNDVNKRRSSHNLQAAFSMEDLLFID
ncbi:uncharacterized protein [Anabrus simplex]|uniref:uncharacterized protein n=1 Tax=Anabrus simplex TaxID=316456 RepID=UPI0035A2BBD0